MSATSTNPHISISFKFQGQILRSNMSAFYHLIELTIAHYLVKLRQNLTSSFRVMGKFLTYIFLGLGLGCKGLESSGP